MFAFYVPVMFAFEFQIRFVYVFLNNTCMEIAPRLFLTSIR